MATLVFILLLLKLSRISCISSWTHSNIKLPIAMKSQQVAYNEPIIYLFRGITNSSKSRETLKWNVSDNKGWSVLNDDGAPFVSNTQSVAVIRDMVYFVENNIFMFNMTSQQWIGNINIPSIRYKQSDGCVTRNNSHIFVIGGVYDDDALNEKSYLQIYDIDNNEWLLPKQIPVATSWSNQMCNMINRRMLYIFGGVIANQNVSNMVYRYDTHAQNWTFIANMSNAVHDAWSVHDKRNERIYIVGGTNDDRKIVNKIKVFDIETERFLGHNIMMDNVQNAATVITSDKLIVFGGCTSVNNEKNTCKLLSTIQISSLPLHVTPRKPQTVYWIIAVFVAVILVAIFACCWLELKVLSKRSLVNADNLITNKDLREYKKLNS